MSIIQEALEKAQSDGKPEASLPKSVQATKKPEKIAPSTGIFPRRKATSRMPDKKAFITAVSFIVLALALLLVVRFLSGTGDRTNRTSAKNSQEVSYRPLVRDTVKEPSEPVNKETAPDLVLNGIMYIEGRPRAIVNNFIVEQGDSVLGATVTGIKRESVVLEYEDMEITLNLK
jgi:hypothetical protein